MKEEDSWVHPNRRFNLISSEFMLPSTYEIEAPNKERVEVWFFLDTSGSCSHLGERFFKAAASLPENRFDVKLFCFDTGVYPTSLKEKKLYGFGGTCFHQIEDYIQQETKAKNKKYPKAVFVVTDGYGSDVYPEHPKKWHWFLTPHHSTSNIPKECNKYNLKDFE
jgi:hypothetical protein